MKPPPFGYARPETTAGALSLLAALGPDAKVLAGGQSLLPLMSLRLAAPSYLVDINGINDLSYIRVENGQVRVGALARHSEVLWDQSAGAAQPLLAQALRHVAHPAIRNRGTTTGSVVHADPAGEMTAVLALLAGTVKLASAAGTRDVPAGEFFVGTLESAVQPGELATEVVFPALQPGAGTGFAEVSRRRGDYAIAGVAALVQLAEDGRIRHARAAYLSVGPCPLVLDLTDAVAGLAVADLAVAGPEDAGASGLAAAARLARARLDPGSDIHATAAYRRHLAGVLTERALREAAAMAQYRQHGETAADTPGRSVPPERAAPGNQLPQECAAPGTQVPPEPTPIGNQLVGPNNQPMGYEGGPGMGGEPPSIDNQLVGYEEGESGTPGEPPAGDVGGGPVAGLGGGYAAGVGGPAGVGSGPAGGVGGGPGSGVGGGRVAGPGSGYAAGVGGPAGVGGGPVVVVGELRRVRLVVNGAPYDVRVPPRLVLADCLRNDLRLTGTHLGCEHGVCGACTVLVGGVPVRSCLMLAVSAHDAEITTVEGLAGPDGKLSPVQQAFTECHGLQCGFCTPGFLTTVTAALRETPDPTPDQAREIAGGNLCRCTGYQNIVGSVLRAAELCAAELCAAELGAAEPRVAEPRAAGVTRERAGGAATDPAVAGEGG